MILDITKEEFNIFKNIKTGIHENNKNHKGKHCLNVDSLKKGDKLYVFPTCKIKKLPMRKYIKSLGVKQVFKPEDATVLIVGGRLISSNCRYSWNKHVININEGYIIPKGIYYFKHDPTKLLRDVKQDIIEEKTSMLRFIFRNQIQTSRYNHYNHHTIDETLLNNYDKKYKLETRNDMGVNHVMSLIDDKTILINEEDLQQAVYDWEVENKVRDDSSEFNWSGIQQLLESTDSYNLAIQMIYKLDFEAIKSNLIACYYGDTISTDAKKAIYEKIFKRNPKLIKCIDRHVSNQTYWSERGIVTLLRKCISYDIELDLNTFTCVNLKIEKFTASNGDDLFHIYEINT